MYHGFAELGDRGGCGLGQTTYGVIKNEHFDTDPHMVRVCNPLPGKDDIEMFMLCLCLMHLISTLYICIERHFTMKADHTAYLSPFSDPKGPP